MKKLLFCWMRKDANAGSVDATWRISSSSLRMCARQDCFVFERPQVVFYCNFSSSRHVSKSRQSHWSDSENQTKKMNLRRLKKNWRFFTCRFSCRCAHSHWRPLFSHEALNVGEYHARNSSRCVRAGPLVTRRPPIVYCKVLYCFQVIKIFFTKKKMFFGEARMVRLWHHCEKLLLEALFFIFSAFLL